VVAPAWHFAQYNIARLHEPLDHPDTAEVWESPEQLQEFVYRSAHTDFLRRRREWFERPTEAYFVCWWILAGEVPPVEHAVERLERLRRDGPSDEAFTLRDLRPQPSASALP
jgi:hypothetical protein